MEVFFQILWPSQNIQTLQTLPVASRLELLAKALDKLKLSWSLALWSFNSLELPNICLHVWQVYKSPVTPAENKEIFKTFSFCL